MFGKRVSKRSIGTLHSSPSFHSAEWNEGEECKVPIDRLDTLLPNTKIQGIKMDVENFEYFVLKGGLKIIQRDQPIIYTELWDNENRTQCFDILGYRNIEFCFRCPKVLYK